MSVFNEAYKNKPLLFGSDPTPELLAAVNRYSICGHALELGCGDGRDTLHMLKKGFYVTALDLSEYAIKHLMQRDDIKPYIPDALTTKVSDIMNEDLGFEKYDFIYSITVIDNFSSKEQEILETRILNALFPGGHLYLTVHTEDDDGYAGQGSEFASEIKHYFKNNELLYRFISKGRVLFYQEAKEEDLEHGIPHFHGFSHILLQKKGND